MFVDRIKKLKEELMSRCPSIENLKASVRDCWSGPINPIILTIRDQALEEKFMLQFRLSARGRLAKVTVMTYVYLLYLMLKYSDEMSPHYWNITMVVELTL